MRRYTDPFPIRSTAAASATVKCGPGRSSARANSSALMTCFSFIVALRSFAPFRAVSYRRVHLNQIYSASRNPQRKIADGGAMLLYQFVIRNAKRLGLDDRQKTLEWLAPRVSRRSFRDQPPDQHPWP